MPGNELTPRRRFLQGLAAAAIGAAALPVERLLAQRAGSARTEPPNIVYILVDDMGYYDLACYGNRVVQTPHIDRLASQGLRMTDAYAACPVCSPTRASILTGKYPARIRLTDFIPGKKPQGEKLLPPDWTKRLLPEEVTLPEVLKGAGYRTALVGKWHLEGKPVEHGFDEELALSHKPRTDDPEWTRTQAKAAIDFMQRNKDRRFFCYVSFNAVHVPLYPRPELDAKYSAKVPAGSKPKADYLAVIEELDSAVGAILKQIDDLGLRDKTLVVLMSDNGGFAGSTNNAPLQGVKGTLYEGGIRVPMIVRWPGVVKAGTESDAVVTSADHYPTLLEVAQARGDAKHNAMVDGASLVPLLQGKRPPQREAIYWHYPHYHAGDPSGAVRAGDWKLIEFYEDGRLLLYNLKDDPSESKNLALSQPGKARELRTMLDKWRIAVGAQMPVPNPAYKPK